MIIHEDTWIKLSIWRLLDAPASSLEIDDKGRLCRYDDEFKYLER